jgi:pimeloyl-ACP methyl ester carboxylesterase
MSVQWVEMNGLTIAYETFGDATDPPMLLVMGLGSQMLSWPESFCHQLAQQGFYVVRFDNRDIGLSTHLESLPVPGILAVALRRRRPPYSIDDMASDSIGLLDALGLGAVHVVGASMGGFIAQAMALRTPGRIASLTLIMTSTGSQRVGQARLSLRLTLLRGRPAVGREAAIARSLAMARLISSPDFEFDEAAVGELAGQSYDRAHDADANRRQLAAVVGQSNRTRALRHLLIPTLVMHGLQDRLVNPSGGLALARAIPGARFVGFQGMGHDLPRPLQSALISEILALTERAVAGSARRSTTD